MIVAFHFPHNEGVVYGIFTEPGQDTKLTLVDLYEVDGRLRTFENVEAAREWLSEYSIPADVELNQVYDIQDERY